MRAWRAACDGGATLSGAAAARIRTSFAALGEGVFRVLVVCDAPADERRKAAGGAGACARRWLCRRLEVLAALAAGIRAGGGGWGVGGGGDAAEVSAGAGRQRGVGVRDL